MSKKRDLKIVLLDMELERAVRYLYEVVYEEN
jgi:hypothetical protein